MCPILKTNPCHDTPNQKKTDVCLSLLTRNFKEIHEFDWLHMDVEPWQFFQSSTQQCSCGLIASSLSRIGWWMMNLCFTFWLMENSTQCSFIQSCLNHPINLWSSIYYQWLLIMYYLIIILSLHQKINTTIYWPCFILPLIISSNYRYNFLGNS